MQRKSRTFIVLMLLISICACMLFSASQEADWSSDVLSQPLAVDGRIRHNEDNRYSFQLNDSGIPEEPVIFKADLKDSINQETGTDSEGEQLFDIEKLRFVSDGFISYVGAKVLSIRPDVTDYYDNGNLSEGEGSNIDLIKGGRAVLHVAYNPETTHQKGALWYCVNDPAFDDFAAIPGSSDCTVYGNRTTNLSGDGAGTDLYQPKILRAVSVYDPWFDEMEERYSEEAKRLYAEQHPDASAEEIASVTWKSEYLKKTSEEHLYSGTDGIWSYPPEDEVSVYTDYMITVRSPIEMVTFTAQPEYAVGESETSAPMFIPFYDEENHPSKTSVNRIWCYDTSDPSDDGPDVAAFRITPRVDPDYGYSFEYELVKGNAIGYLDFSDLDGNVFRFVPRGAYNAGGETRANYGEVVIKMTAKEIGYSKYFSLVYMPSNMKLVKYIGEDMEGWNKGIVIDKDTGEVIDSVSGEWDTVTYQTQGERSRTALYGMECLVLYPGETFELAVVQYLDNHDGSGTQPYYITDGVPGSTNLPSSGDEEEDEDGAVIEDDSLRYAISYSIAADEDPESDPIPGIVKFEHYAEVIEDFDPTIDGVTDMLSPADHDTGQSYWYMDKNTGSYGDNAQRLVAVKEGVYYLRYLIAPVSAGWTGEDEASLAEATISGGIYLYITSPVNQGLSSVIDGQVSEDIMLEIPHRISAAQRRPGVDEDGDPMPSHWYLGEDRGAIRYPVLDATGAAGNVSIYMGAAYMLLSEEKTAYSQGPEGFDASSLTPVSEIDMGDRYLEIYDGTGGVPGTPEKLSQWQGTFAISEAAGSGTNVRKKPDIADVIITGDYGLACYPGIHNLRIIDNAGVGDRISGLFTLSNLLVDGNEGIWDMSSLDLFNYEHANMGEVGRRITEMRLPGNLVSLNLDSADVMNNTTHRSTVVENNLDCDFTWKANGSLKELRIGNNRFSNLEMQGFPSLQFISADGSAGFDEGLNNNERSLIVHECPELEYVQANDTFFNNIMVEFPWTVPSSNLTEPDASARIHTMLRADGSDQLRKVNVSGHLSYLELAGNPNLISVIGSDRFDPDDPDSFSTSPSYNGASSVPSDAGWIRIINLGGPIGVHIDKPEVLGISQQRSGDSTSWLHRTAASDEASAAMDLSAWSVSKGSCNIQTLKLNYVYRLHSASGNSDSQDIFHGDAIKGSGYDKSSLTNLEVFAIVPDAATQSNWSTVSKNSDTHYSSGNKSGSTFPVYSFDYRHAGTPSSRILFQHVPEDVSINLSGGGMRNVEIQDFQGFLNLYMATDIDDIRINESAGSSAGSDSLVELSRSGIRNLTGAPVFAGVNISPLAFDMLLPANENGGHDMVSDTFTITAFPSSFNTQISVTATSSDSSICSVSVGKATADGIVVTVTGRKAGTTTIKVVCQSGGKSESATVTVNVEEEYVPSYTVSLVGGKDEIIDGKTVRVLEFDTRDSSPAKMELKVMDDIGMDVTKDVLQDYRPEAPDNPFLDGQGVPLTYEDFYLSLSGGEGVSRLVTWSFEETGHPNQAFAQIVIDSYMGNRVYIDPLVDDDEYTCTVRFQDAMYGIDYTATFLVRVKGGGAERWKVEISADSDPARFREIGSSQTFTASVYDRQLLSNGQPSYISPSMLREAVVWDVSGSAGIVDYRLDGSGENNTVARIYALDNGTGKVAAIYRSGQVVGERNVVVDAFDIKNSSRTSGDFSVQDGSNNRDNVWDIAWALDVQDLDGNAAEVDSSSITGGTIRFTTSKGVFDFDICSGLEGDYISFRADSCPSFTYKLIAPGTYWGDSHPNDSYSDTDYFWLFGYAPQAQAISLLNSGTVEIVELSFRLNSVEYTWKSASLISEEMGPLTKSVLLSSRAMVVQSPAVTANEYSQVFTAPSMISTDSDMDSQEAPRLKSLSRMMAAALSTDDATIVNANVTRIALNRCPNLTDITISIDSNKVTANGLVHLEADENPVLTDVFINLDAQGRLEDISMTLCPKLKTFYAKAPDLKIAEVFENKSLSSVTFTVECVGLERLDLHNNALGAGSMAVGNFKYQNHSFSVGTVRDYLTAMPGLLYFAAYGNGIYQNTNSNGTTYTYRLGSGIPDGSRIIYYHVTSSWQGGGKGQFSYSGTKGSWSDNRSNSVGIFDWDGNVNYSGSINWSSAKTRCDEMSNLKVRAWSKHNNTKSINVYPFGE